MRDARANLVWNLVVKVWRFAAVPIEPLPGMHLKRMQFPIRPREQHDHWHDKEITAQEVRLSQVRTGPVDLGARILKPGSKFSFHEIRSADRDACQVYGKLKEQINRHSMLFSHPMRDAKRRHNGTRFTARNPLESVVTPLNCFRLGGPPPGLHSDAQTAKSHQRPRNTHF